MEQKGPKIEGLKARTKEEMIQKEKERLKKSLGRVPSDKSAKKSKKSKESSSHSETTKDSKPKKSKDATEATEGDKTSKSKPDDSTNTSEASDKTTNVEKDRTQEVAPKNENKESESKVEPPSPPSINVTPPNSTSDVITKAEPRGEIPEGERSPKTPVNRPKFPHVPHVPPQLPIYDKSNKELKEVDPAVWNQTFLTKLHLFRNQLTSIPSGLILTSIAIKTYLEIQNLVNLTVLDLSYNKLSSLPSSICELVKLQQLLLTGNFMAVFPKQLNKLEALSLLDLTSNKMRFFPLEITKIPNLTTLEISRNRFRYLPLHVKQMTSLVKLNLAENRLQSLPSQIGCLTSLTSLNISENHLHSIPNEIGSLVALTELDLTKNHLTSVPSELGQLTTLIKLKLSYNQLSSLPSPMFEEKVTEEGVVEKGLVYLQELYLRDNQLSSLPDTFWNLTSLQLLDLSHNYLSLIPSALGNLQNMVKLNLGMNKINSIPPEIGTLQYLEVLNLFANQLATLPQEITSLAGLRKLNVGYNQLSTLPLTEAPEYLEWESLEELYVSGNPMKEVPAAIGNLWTLRELYAGNALIEKIPGEIQQLTNLQNVDFSANQISTITPEMSLLVNLQRLMLQENKLVEVSEEIFSEYSQITEIDLSRNRIAAVPRLFEDFVDKGVDILMDHNPCNIIKGQDRDVVQPSRFQYGYSEMTGRRPTMEDALILKGTFGGRKDADLFGVFDGHAGSEAARFSAKEFPKVLQKKLEEGMDPVDSLTETMSEVNSLFREYIKTQDVNVKHCGATALAVLILNRTLYSANLGDTRAVLCRNGKAIRVSYDHKPMDEEDRINALGGYVIGGATRRINGLVAVSRSIGDFYLTPFIIDEPYVAQFELTADDEFLILACDGVWDEISDQEAVDLVKSEKDPYAASMRLRDYAYCLGSDDNISVIVVHLK